MQPHRLALLASLISATAFCANANGRFDNLYTLVTVSLTREVLAVPISLLRIIKRVCCITSRLPK